MNCNAKFSFIKIKALRCKENAPAQHCSLKPIFLLCKLLLPVHWQQPSCNKPKFYKAIFSSQIESIQNLSLYLVTIFMIVGNIRILCIIMFCALRAGDRCNMLMFHCYHHHHHYHQHLYHHHYQAIAGLAQSGSSWWNIVSKEKGKNLLMFCLQQVPSVPALLRQTSGTKTKQFFPKTPQNS